MAALEMPFRGADVTIFEIEFFSRTSEQFLSDAIQCTTLKDVLLCAYMFDWLFEQM